MYTDKTGKLPHTSSQGNKYQMIIHNIDINSTWVDPIKDITEGEMLLGRGQSLERMKICGIIPKYQMFDTEASKAYKESIQ